MTIEVPTEFVVPIVPAKPDANHPLASARLGEIITQVLEEHDGLCMDVPEEREELRDALLLILNDLVQSIAKPDESDANPTT